MVGERHALWEDDKYTSGQMLGEKAAKSSKLTPVSESITGSTRKWCRSRTTVGM